MNRLLSRREKDGAGHRRAKSQEKPTIKKTRPLSGTDAILSLFRADPEKKLEKEHLQKTQTLKHRLQKDGYLGFEEAHANYALSSKFAGWDVDKGYEIAVLLQDSVVGDVYPYVPTVTMLGAENREFVTCWLDSLLFAMFARPGSFEPILYKGFEDEPRRRLTTLIRIWVNMLRTGKLIQTDLTRHLQEALVACGWNEAADIQQQDTSEGFRFIAEKLDLPLLTMKVDIFHHATEDATGDHKIVHERLLDVAIEEPEDGREIKLEHCLEDYCNNMIQVNRTLRTYTLSSIHSGQLPEDPEKEDVTHIETAEMSSPNTPLGVPSPATAFPPTLRHRAPSVFRPRLIEGQPPGQKEENTLERTTTSSSIGKKSVRKEVTIPAWQFFNLMRPLPIYFKSSSYSELTPPNSPVLIGETAWYTNHSPSPNPSVSDVAAQFSRSRPLLGICLKRYAMEDGKLTKKNTYVNIPQEMRLPHFIDDDDEESNTQGRDQIGKFKLSLQSVVCHRGKQVNEGHYVSLVRGNGLMPDNESRSSRRPSTSSSPPDYPEDVWYKFDDLATPRVRIADYEEEMRKETPYLLFYQVVPLEATGASESGSEQPPSYTNSDVAMQQSNEGSMEKCMPIPQQNGYFDGSTDTVAPTARLRLETIEAAKPPTPRASLEVPSDRPYTRSGSLAYVDSSVISSVVGSATPSILATSAPTTPIEETTAQRMSRAAARFTGGKSRPSSQSGAHRISATFSRLNLRRSRDQLRDNGAKDPAQPDNGGSPPQEPIAGDEGGLAPSDKHLGRSKSKREKRRSKGKGTMEEIEPGATSLSKGRGRRKANDSPERECKIM